MQLSPLCLMFPPLDGATEPIDYWKAYRPWSKPLCLESGGDPSTASSSHRNFAAASGCLPAVAPALTARDVADIVQSLAPRSLSQTWKPSRIHSPADPQNKGRH